MLLKAGDDFFFFGGAGRGDAQSSLLLGAPPPVRRGLMQVFGIGGPWVSFFFFTIGSKHINHIWVRISCQVFISCSGVRGVTTLMEMSYTWYAVLHGIDILVCTIPDIVYICIICTCRYCYCCHIIS